MRSVLLLAFGLLAPLEITHAQSLNLGGVDVRVGEDATIAIARLSDTYNLQYQPGLHTWFVSRKNVRPTDTFLWVASPTTDAVYQHETATQDRRYLLKAVRAPRGLGPKAFTAELQILGFPSSSDDILAAVKSALLDVTAKHEACTVLFRVHSPQSKPSEDALADLGTAFARSASPTCGGTVWAWENHLRVVQPPSPSRVAVERTAIFSDVPLPIGSRFKRNVEGRAGPCRIYSSSLGGNQIRDFYRQEMVKRGYSEWPNLGSDRTLLVFDNGKQVISISWSQASEIEIQREAVP
jgi:hypothetical protein